MADIPRANPLPTDVTTASIGGGLASGLSAGAQMGYQAAQTTAQNIQNKFAPMAAQLAAQKQAAEIRKQQIESGLGIAKTASEGYDRFGDDFGPEIFNTFKKGMNMAYPGAIPDEMTFSPEIGGVMKQAGKIIDGMQSGDVTQKDGMYALAKLKTKASKVQQERLQGVITPVEDVFNQSETAKRTAENIGAENTRAAAGATGPLIGTAYSVKLAKTALAKGDELNDHIALNEFGKIVNNGTAIPLPELMKMAKAGTWGPKLAQAFSGFTGEGALSDTQRGMIQSALDTFGESVKSQVETRTAQYPGANPPPMPAISAYKVGQAVKFRQGTYKKIKDGSDLDSSTWEVVKSSGTP